MRARMKNAADRVIYRAWCPNCEIYLRKTTQGRNEGKWETSHVKHDELQSELSHQEFLELTLNVEESALLDDTFQTEKRWNEFISMKKEDDKVYSYIQGNSTTRIKGYVIKRDSFIIGFFVHNIETSEDEDT